MMINSTPDLKRPKFETLTTTIDQQHDNHLKQTPPPLLLLDEPRRLFQRLWTDEDEIQLLQGFLHYSSQRGFPIGNSWSNHQDTTMFYEQIRGKLHHDFNKNQLVRKLRRMKKKYRNVESKIRSGKNYAFKSPHDQLTFQISRRIWRENGIAHTLLHHQHAETNLNQIPPPPPPQNGIQENNNRSEQSRKRSRTVKLEEEQEEEIAAAPVRTPNTTTTTVSSMALNSLPFGLLNFEDFDKNTMSDKWRKQQILELEVYSKRLELIQDHIKYVLTDLISIEGSNHL
ncbi:probable transcription factor At3g04930 [Impatiens glandulifera]|uniref:probable transcription factor At3g04930 n=1 Tax=Impatiens glandulifera TaxID=253017 RepID=UPI001FB0C9BF|nr:probable transcription factor At3g04930 [Impatiens glandulifera]